MSKKAAICQHRFSALQCDRLRLPMNSSRLRYASAFSGRGLLLALGAFALEQIFVSQAAFAQSCIEQASPAPAAPAGDNSTNKSFGFTPPFMPYFLYTVGIYGCNGNPNTSMVNGYVGQSGGSVSVNTVNATIFGASGNTAASILSLGGIGGLGADNTGTDPAPNGGAGGDGGGISGGFSGTLRPNQGGEHALTGLSAVSYGGSGGSGAPSIIGGIGGIGATGGNGGAITLGVGGTFLVATGGTGAFALSLGGSGGMGGQASPSLGQETTAGAAGRGGAGGNVVFSWLEGSINGGAFGLGAVSQGGNGGLGGTLNTTNGYTGAGGAGGNAGNASLVMASGIVAAKAVPSFLGFGTGVIVQSNGGDGGDGGTISGQVSPAGGGAGGNGGNGASASATISGSVSYTGLAKGTAVSGQGVLVQSNGGGGGTGTTVASGYAGPGGLAGNGGSASLALGTAQGIGTIQTSQGSFAHGALVQSIGGGGGLGGQAGFNGDGGAGASGGDGASVSVTARSPVFTSASQTSIIVSGPNGIAVLAQSVGGGGGSGGSDTGIDLAANLSIGGNGGAGGNGGTVEIGTLTQPSNVPVVGLFASLSTTGGGGILAQSIGGSGGSGGSASSVGAGLLNFTIGGDAKGGGSGGTVTVNHGGLIGTWGDHASGIEAQSIGGGGGKGGAAYSRIGSVFPTAAVAVGGRGGSGGPGGTVSLVNSGQIATYGADAFGIKLQSIGGGGGTGGSAVSNAVDISPDKRVPGLSISTSIGGTGGSGNTGGEVTLVNSGLVLTAGDGSSAATAQSIGGGGGTAGDSTATSYVGGANKGGISVSVSTSVGGSGGSGGTGSTVTLSNTGLLATLGQDAASLLGQSIGGGGGIGGFGDSKSTVNKSKVNIAVSVAVGGSGGSGGDAASTTLTNSGGITSSGDGSDGVLAQSIGGGGGIGGGGVATTSGGKLSVDVQVGGSGGAGGNGGTASVENSGAVITRGTDSVGLFVQSIGGGGGKGGKAGATAGGITPGAAATALANAFTNGLNLGVGKTSFGNGIVQIGPLGEPLQLNLTELGNVLQQPQAGSAVIGAAPSVNVNVVVGGGGGTGGTGGSANATNTGAIITYGAQSDGIYAQSVGGGGGSGGAATSTNTSGTASTTILLGNLGSINGSSSGGGSGGVVNVDNGVSGTGTILTQGVAAFGIVGQSVGGGGGKAAAAGTLSGAFLDVGFNLGGQNGTSGSGGDVTVTMGNGMGAGSVITMGKNAIGIVAQSVGGGGGILRTMTTDQTSTSYQSSRNVLQSPSDLQQLLAKGLNQSLLSSPLGIGGTNGASGTGGTVTVVTSNAITTMNRDAHGIVAQSVGGGGGLLVGGQLNESIQSSLISGSGGGSGGGAVNVNLGAGTRIATTGDGAYGVIAQSVGGGGGIGGDLSTVNSYLGSRYGSIQTNGDGGAVALTATNTSIQTSGALAPAIFAQSVGGGGGLFSASYSFLYNNSLRIGTFGGNGVGGNVNVTLTNSTVVATGSGSSGILAQSDGGNADGSIAVTVGQGSVVQQGGTTIRGPQSVPTTLETNSAAVRLVGGLTNTITNAGTIQNIVGSNAGYAIRVDAPGSGGTASITNTSTGQIIGMTLCPSCNVLNVNGGLIDPRGSLDLGGSGVLTNAGTLEVGGAGAIGRTFLNGDLKLVPSGILRIDTNAVTGRSDLLEVSGRANLAGRIVLNQFGLTKGTSDSILTAQGGITLTPQVTGALLPIFTQVAQVNGNSLVIRTDADFGTTDPTKTDNQRSLATYLQRVWDGGVAGFERGFGNIGRISSVTAFSSALDALSGQDVAAVSSLRFEASQNFARDAFACSVLSDDPRLRTSGSCTWGRAAGSVIDRGGNGFPAYNWATTSLKVGGQVEIAPDLYMAGAIGYENAQLNDGGSRARGITDTGMVLVALRYQAGPWTFDSAFDVAYGGVDLRRKLSGLTQATAQTSTDAFNAGFHIRAGYTMSLGPLYVEPNVEFDANVVRIGGYTERGADVFNLQISSLNDTILAATPGVRIGSRVAIGPSIAANLYAGVGVSFLTGNTFEVDARFASLSSDLGSFQTRLANDDVVGRFVAGVELQGTEGLGLRLQYIGRQSAVQTEHGGQLRMEYKF